MSQPTKEQWSEIEKQLDRMYDAVYLLCDGFYVRYCLTRYKRKLIIDCYINGMFKGEWYGTDEAMAEEAKRFWRPSVVSKYTPKELKSWEKIIGKRECKKRGYYEKHIFPWPWWNCQGPLIRHLKKHNENIEIIDYETYAAAIKEMIDEQKSA